MSVSNVAIVAPTALTEDRIFKPSLARDNVLERFKLLAEKLALKRISCHTLDMLEMGEVDVLIFHDIMNELNSIIGVIKSRPDVRLMYIPNEPPFVVPFHHEDILLKLPVDLMFTWNDRIAGQLGHIEKLNVGQPVINPDEIPSVNFADKKFICSIFAYKPPRIVGTLFEERLRVVECFASKELGIDLYGIGWEEAEIDFIESVYRGPIANKIETQKSYKFSIAFENTKNHPGLISEKIFDCFAAGTVPVYLGAPNIGDYIPRECFLDVRDFADYDELYEDLAHMSESRYKAYLSAAQEFIRSAKYYSFTSANFAEVIAQRVDGMTESSKKRSVTGVKWALLKLLFRCPGLFTNWRRFRRFLFNLTFSW